MQRLVVVEERSVDVVWRCSHDRAASLLGLWFCLLKHELNISTVQPTNKINTSIYVPLKSLIKMVKTDLFHQQDN